MKTFKEFKDKNINEAVSPAQMAKKFRKLEDDMEKLFYEFSNHADDLGISDKDFSDWQKSYNSFEKQVKNIQKKL